MLERLFVIDWRDSKNSIQHNVSRAKLMREYLRRAALWVNELGGTDRWPFFDIAGRIAPSVRTNPDLAARLERYIEENVGGISTEDALRAILRWATLRDVHKGQLPYPNDPFEPLLVMYERGGEVVADEARFFNFGHRSVRLKPWPQHLSPDPVVSLDPATLDALDREES
ncbi:MULTISPECIES: hypothetical protein [Streptomycetaceae]|uniref:hypothetical protein n=1 Tax=Streptomycetaceae TaxID=2062 RepID=UPI001E603071|nr:MULTISPECIES: hypothetical protein [Streptomycetaceae]